MYKVSLEISTLVLSLTGYFVIFFFKPAISGVWNKHSIFCDYVNLFFAMNKFFDLNQRSEGYNRMLSVIQ